MINIKLYGFNDDQVILIYINLKTLYIILSIPEIPKECSNFRSKSIGETFVKTDSTKNMKNQHHADTQGAEAKSTQNPMIPETP